MGYFYFWIYFNVKCAREREDAQSLAALHAHYDEESPGKNQNNRLRAAVSSGAPYSLISKTSQNSIWPPRAGPYVATSWARYRSANGAIFETYQRLSQSNCFAWSRGTDSRQPSLYGNQSKNCERWQASMRTMVSIRSVTSRTTSGSS